jgi:hypothetical protein
MVNGYGYHNRDDEPLSLHFIVMVEATAEEEILQAGRYDFIGRGAVLTWLAVYASHDRWV